MAKSKQTFLKSQKEKQKRLKQKEKDEKKSMRKENSSKGKGVGFESMIAYIDHNGQLTNTPPDPKFKVEIKAEDISI